MKLHLPITLLTAVLAACIALPAQAVEAPEGYTTTYLNRPGTLERYSELTEDDYIAFILGGSLEFTPTSADYWSSSTPLVSGGNVFFGTDDVDSPVALSFTDGSGSAFSGQSTLTFDTLSNLTFSTITDNEPAIRVVKGTLTITNVNDGQSNTMDVLFKDIKNTSSSGGAICADNGDVTISNNGNVSFSGNSSSFSSPDDYYSSPDYCYSSSGGAICAGYGDVTISHNGDVSFSGNSSYSDSYYSHGGAICADSGDVTISQNGNVSFSGNSSYSYDYSYGGAISACRGLTIQGNDSVLFEKNYENNNGVYRLRSIYSGNTLDYSDGTQDMTLSAKTGGNITFYDSVYSSGATYFNSDYTDADGNTQSADGDVIFSGKYAEQHLNEILAANNENRTATAKEILNSQTSTFGGTIYLQNGSLQIVDGAVLKVNGNTVSIEEGSNATLAVSDAELVATNATIEVGASATLQLSNGASVTADEINIAAGATLAIGDIAVTTSAIDSMVAAYRISSLNVINGDLTFAAGSTLVTDGSGISMTEGSVLTFNATSKGEKINLVFTLGTEYGEDGLVQLFSNVDIVKFLMDGKEVDTSTTLLASDFFTGASINDSTTLHYDSANKVVYLQGVSNAVPEPTTATLSLLALAALAMRRRRK